MPRQLELSIPKRVAFFLMPGFCLNELSFAVTPLRIANQHSPTLLYQPVLYALRVREVPSSEGPRLMPEETTSSAPHPPHLVLVCAPDIEHSQPQAIEWLRTLAQRHIPVGGIAGGCRLLVQAGLLDGYRQVPSLSADSSHEYVEAHYEIDRDRLTCNSPVAALEMMIQLIGTEHGPEVAHLVRQRLVRDGFHPALGEQDALTKERLTQNAPRLLTAIRLMEANRGSPLAPSVLAQRIGMSLRHFERLFQEHCHCSPRQYYLGVRLDHGRELLRHTDLSVGDVSRAVGLESSSYFSRRYRERFGHPPTGERG